MTAKSATNMVIFSMHVIRYGPAQGGEFRSGSDREEPPLRNCYLKNLTQGDA